MHCKISQKLQSEGHSKNTQTGTVQSDFAGNGAAAVVNNFTVSYSDGLGLEQIKSLYIIFNRI